MGPECLTSELETRPVQRAQSCHFPSPAKEKAATTEGGRGNDEEEEDHLKLMDIVINMKTSAKRSGRSPNVTGSAIRLIQVIFCSLECNGLIAK